MAVAHMVTLDGAQNISLPRIAVRFTDTASTYFTIYMESKIKKKWF